MQLPQPLICPASMLPEDVVESLEGKELLDYGLSVQSNKFRFAKYYCEIPTSLVVAYALSAINSGGASRALLAGFDGYVAGDPRYAELDMLIRDYLSIGDHCPILAVTPTRHILETASIYAL